MKYAQQVIKAINFDLLTTRTYSLVLNLPKVNAMTSCCWVYALSVSASVKTRCKSETVSLFLSMYSLSWTCHFVSNCCRPIEQHAISPGFAQRWRVRRGYRVEPSVEFREREHADALEVMRIAQRSEGSEMLSCRKCDCLPILGNAINLYCFYVSIPKQAFSWSSYARP